VLLTKRFVVVLVVVLESGHIMEYCAKSKLHPRSG
jgi:hypothetical protein